MNFYHQLNPQVFLNAADLMCAWAESNPQVDKLSDYYNGWQATYTSHCCLRAIKEANHMPRWSVHYHRAYFSFLFCPPRITDSQPYWKNSYEARIMALYIAAHTIL